VIRGAVLVLSYQPIFLDGILAGLAAYPGLRVAGHGLAAEDVPALLARTRPSLVLLDSGEPDRGLATIAAIRRGHPATHVVVLTAVEGVEHAVAALEAGAAGYLSSRTTAAELAAAIGHVLAGETYLSPTLATAVIAAIRTADREAEAFPGTLSLREQQIAHHLLKGRTNREIASGLGLREKTVKHYMTLLMQKFDARNRLELALRLERPEATPPVVLTRPAPKSASWARGAAYPGRLAGSYRPATDAA
jgi:DNA-binding NarL/FixJ family response regulator